MGTKKDAFAINQIKDILQIHEQTIKIFFNSTLEGMDKKISDLIGENAVLKNVLAELKKSLQFHTDQWEDNFKTWQLEEWITTEPKTLTTTATTASYTRLKRNQRQAEPFRKP